MMFLACLFLISIPVAVIAWVQTASFAEPVEVKEDAVKKVPVSHPLIYVANANTKKRRSYYYDYFEFLEWDKSDWAG